MGLGGGTIQTKKLNNGLELNDFVFTKSINQNSRTTYQDNQDEKPQTILPDWLKKSQAMAKERTVLQPYEIKYVKIKNQDLDPNASYVFNGFQNYKDVKPYHNTIYFDKEMPSKIPMV